MSIHECGGTISVAGSGELRHSYCDRCKAYAYGEGRVPAGTIRLLNLAAYDAQYDESPADLIGVSTGLLLETVQRYCDMIPFVDREGFVDKGLSAIFEALLSRGDRESSANWEPVCFQCGSWPGEGRPCEIEHCGERATWEIS